MIQDIVILSREKFCGFANFLGLQEVILTIQFAAKCDSIAGIAIPIMSYTSTSIVIPVKTGSTFPGFPCSL
jgi:hypothetical protein